MSLIGLLYRFAIVSILIGCGITSLIFMARIRALGGVPHFPWFPYLSIGWGVGLATGTIARILKL